MTFYTFLVLTYVVAGVEIEKKTLYRNAHECGNALPSVYKPYEDMDSMAQCIETDKASSIYLTPKLRPVGLSLND
jgi:hypothetical protein